MDCSPPGILQARILEGLLCPIPGDLLNPGIKPTLLMSPALAGGFFTDSATWEALHWLRTNTILRGDGLGSRIGEGGLVRSSCNNLWQMGAQAVGEIRCWVDSEQSGWGLLLVGMWSMEDGDT